MYVHMYFYIRTIQLEENNGNIVALHIFHPLEKCKSGTLHYACCMASCECFQFVKWMTPFSCDVIPFEILNF